MKIQCRIKREGGSRVTMGGQEYHFAPDDLGRHVAEVEDESHVERFLAIREYTEVSDDGEAKAVPVTQGQTLDPQTGDEGGDKGGDAPKDETVAPTQDEDLEAARDEYEAFFGKKAHHAMKAETIRERIQQEKDAKA